MMNNAHHVRDFVTFEADFPDDGVFDQSGDPVKPAGKNIAESLVGALRSRNLESTDVVQHSFYGWQFTITYNGCRLWFLLQCPEPWLLLCKPRRSFIAKLRFKDAASAQSDVLAIVHECLKEDRRVGGVRWFTQEEYESYERTRGTDPA